VYVSACVDPTYEHPVELGILTPIDYDYHEDYYKNNIGLLLSRRALCPKD